MKNLISGFLLVIMISGCYTKNQAIKKFCNQDTSTTTITVHDTVVVEKITADTIFSSTVDTVTITKDKLVIKYKKVNGKVHLTGEYKGDTIYKEKIVEVKVPCNCPPEYVPGFWDKVKSWFAVFGIIALIVGVAALGPWSR